MRSDSVEVGAGPPRRRGRVLGAGLALVSLLAVVALTSLALRDGAGERRAGAEPSGPSGPQDAARALPRSIILVVGDGMGPQEIGLWLDVADALGAPSPEFARLIAAADRSIVRTGSANSPVTDSAASATAMATGVDTDNGRIGVDPAGESLRTCLEDARDAGKGTALVTTTRITHATPAAFAAHVPARGDENGIARQLLASGVDILLGGGARHFLGGPGGQALGTEIEAAGYRLVRTADELAAAPRDGKLLGLFAASDLPYRIDRDGGEGEPAAVPGLPALARAALERLDPESGFFLLVEGGRIDHAGHANDAAALVGEMAELDETLALLRAYVRARDDVALIVTADHETGGLCLTYGADGLPGAEELRALAAAGSSIEAAGSRAVTEEEARASIGNARIGFVPEGAWPVNVPALERSAASFVSFGSQGHSATPVLLLHEGAGERLGGLVRHAELGALLRRWCAPPPGGGD